MSKKKKRKEVIVRNRYPLLTHSSYTIEDQGLKTWKWWNWTNPKPLSPHNCNLIHHYLWLHTLRPRRKVRSFLTNYHDITIHTFYYPKGRENKTMTQTMTTMTSNRNLKNLLMTLILTPKIQPYVHLSPINHLSISLESEYGDCHILNLQVPEQSEGTC
jgi:hypothetical protein